MTKIVSLSTLDIRFPTSKSADGSDAMNKDPDYSAAYVILKTDRIGLEGHGLTFTIGRGNEICCAAIKAMEHLVVGKDLDWIIKNMGDLWKELTSDSQLRWIGPDKGAMHLATGAVVNAVWDLWGKYVNKPVWKLVYDLSPEKLVDLISFRYITDCITPSEALDIIKSNEPSKHERLEELLKNGYPCYTTSAGWLGYSDEKYRRLLKGALDSGFNYIKLKVGQNLDDDIRRLKILREMAGNNVTVMIDANQVWEVDQAIDWLKHLEFSKPWFIEEPTSPDDIEGHRKVKEHTSMQVATGEMCQNRIIFKQFIMRNAIDIVQIDSCRIGGVNEILSVMLMAAKYNKKVCPHAGGVGLCEYVQHLSMIDYLRISGTKEGRIIEYVDHLHEYFVEPCIIKNAAYMPPQKPGYSIEMKLDKAKPFIFNQK